MASLIWVKACAVPPLCKWDYKTLLSVARSFCQLPERARLRLEFLNWARGQLRNLSLRPRTEELALQLADFGLCSISSENFSPELRFCASLRIALKLEGERNRKPLILLDFLLRSQRLTPRHLLLQESELLSNLPAEFAFLPPLSEFVADLLPGTTKNCRAAFRDRCLDFFINAGHFVSLPQLCQLCLVSDQDFALNERRTGDCGTKRKVRPHRGSLCGKRRVSH